MASSIVCFSQKERRFNQEILRSEILRESSLWSLDLFNAMVWAKNVRMKEVKNNHNREWNRRG